MQKIQTKLDEIKLVGFQVRIETLSLVILADQSSHALPEVLIKMGTFHASSLMLLSFC